MNEDFVKDIYRAIGLNDADINSRIKQSKILANVNPIGAMEHKGGGVVTACDNYTGKGFAPIVVKDMYESAQIRKAIENMGATRVGDVDTFAFNIPSSGVPLPLLTIWTTRMIQAMYKTTTLAKLAGSWQQGSPGVQEVKIPTIAFDGNPNIYSDKSMNGTTSLNVNWVTRNIGYFEETMEWGDMQQAQFALAKIDYVNKLRESLSITVGQWQNDLGFQGYTGIPDGDSPQLFGILNEPNLNPAISLPADGQIPGTATPTTEWSGKTFNQIVRDIRLLISEVVLNAAGNASIDSKFRMCIPPSAEVALTTPNPISSETVREYLTKTYKNMEIVTTPNFEAALVTTGATTNQTVVMFMFQHPDGEWPYDELFVTKWQGHRPVPMASSIAEKISWGLGGVILKYPLLVSYAYGV